MYEPEALLLMLDGDQVPVTLFVDKSGRAGACPPAQIGGIGLKVGVVGGVTFMVVDAVVVQPHEFVTVSV